MTQSPGQQEGFLPSDPPESPLEIPSIEPSSRLVTQGHGPVPSMELVFTRRSEGNSVRESLEWLERGYAGALTLRQVHGAAVVPALRAQAGAKADGWLLERTGGPWAAIQVADCLPVALYHPASGRGAALHCGHRGLSGGLIGVAASKLRGTFPEGAPEPQGWAWLGPCIGSCCYQVQWDVAQHFQQWPDALQPHPKKGFFLDLKVVARHQLQAQGFEVMGQVQPCTRCHPEMFASYRRDGQAAGRQFLLCRLVAS